MDMKKYCIICLIALSIVLIGLCVFHCIHHIWLVAVIWIGWFLLTVSATILEWHTEKSRMRYDSIKHQNDHNIKITQMSHLHEVVIKGYEKEIKELKEQYDRKIKELHRAWEGC